MSHFIINSNLILCILIKCSNSVFEKFSFYHYLISIRRGFCCKINICHQDFCDIREDWKKWINTFKTLVISEKLENSFWRSYFLWIFKLSANFIRSDRDATYKQNYVRVVVDDEFDRKITCFLSSLSTVISGSGTTMMMITSKVARVIRNPPSSRRKRTVCKGLNMIWKKGKKECNLRK